MSTRRWIYTQEEIPDHEECIKEIGHKAWNLARLNAIDCGVPPWICVKVQVFDHMLESDEGCEIDEFINSYLVNKVGLYDTLPQIRSRLLQLKFPNGFRSELLRTLLESGITAPYAVRSSALQEDTQDRSAAGTYDTLLNVQWLDLMEAIIRCWSSLYNERAFVRQSDRTLLASERKMGVIVQKMVRTEMSGILFTADPTTNDHSRMVIEAGYGMGDRIVSGAQTVSRYFYDKISDYIVVDHKEGPDLNQEEIRRLISISKQVEEELGGPQDIEWGFLHGDKVVLLQSRPVTMLQNCKLDQAEIIALRELNDGQKSLMGAFRQRYHRWKRKKIPFYQACFLTNVPYCGWWLIHYNNETLEEGITKLLPQIRAPFVFVAINEHLMDIHLPINDLLEKLSELCRLVGGQPITISVRESYPTEVSLLSNLTQEGNTYIEYAPGALKGINAGMLIPSNILLSPTGEVISSTEVTNDYYYRFDEEAVDICLSREVVSPQVSIGELQEIARNTKTLTEAMGSPIVVEWWKWKNEILANDVSLLKKYSLSVDLDGLDYTVISPGSLAGRILRIDAIETETLEYLSHGRGVSVSDYMEEMNTFNQLKTYQRRISEMKESGDGVILYLPKPYLFFAPLCSEVDGVVFQRASMLCHFSIILREMGIPAISLDGNPWDGKDGENFIYGSMV